MDKLFTDMRDLLQHRLLINEDPATQTLINKLSHVKQQGYFTKPEFLEMCKWKDARQLRRADWQANTEDEVIALSTQVFAVSDEVRRILLLDRLKGVGIPVASAILTLTDPDAYGVIDIRVWQLLYLYGEVNFNAEGTWLTIDHWQEYLPKLRQWATTVGASARTIERSWFEHHKEIAIGRLYG